jgi:hypothetical protein
MIGFVENAAFHWSKHKNSSFVKKNCPTKRALDGWDSAAFSGFIYARTESCSRSFVHARPPASNASRWAFVIKANDEVSNYQ